mgnify:CR=1 FL=1
MLDALFAPATTLSGVGAATATAVGRLLGVAAPRCFDLLSHLPSAIIDPTPVTVLSDTDLGRALTLRVEIAPQQPPPPRGGPRPHRVLALAAGAPCDLVFFGAGGEHLARRFAPGGTALVHGRLARFAERWQIAHPVLLSENAADLGPIPLYPLVRGLGQTRLRALLARALSRLPELPEWLPAARLRAAGWPSWAEALRALHAPSSAADLEPGCAARRRLACDELLAGQLALGLMREARARHDGRPLLGDGRLRARLIRALPFALTPCQQRAIAEIADDLARPAPMLRLLQGDVGSGKTLVAAASMLQAIEAGAQAALMAPTEVLARQHATTLDRLLAPLGVATALLTGGQPAARRRAALESLAAGATSVAIGTQALLEAGVAFRDLGLVVIDEQHRFGVGQRLDLVVKGAAVDVLLMTATPIPRSLLLAVYGDLITSQLVSKPPGRTPIVTRAVPNARLEQVLAAIERALARDERIYWICPLVAPGEADPAIAAEERHRQLVERFGDRVGLVHGRMNGASKTTALGRFASGAVRLLVATTVVEVGLDVPEATVIVIEHAERYGLAQLHQLRGRVGRGPRASSCLLLYEPPLTDTARARLDALRRTDDGFEIAEADLRLRGPGEVLGVRQSGLPAFRFVDLAHHADLLPAARAIADEALARDPGLRRAASEPLRVLLHLFERQDAVRLLAAG